MMRRRCSASSSMAVPHLCAAAALLLLLLPQASASGARVERSDAPKSIRSRSLSRPEEITYLPGLNEDMLSHHYSGYMNVDEQHGKHLFYWVVHSERDVERDQVVLWLTGGPGCSSMDALIYEHGPFRFSFGRDDEIVLTENPYSWSKVATMIYLDSPVGAGLSYSETKSDYKTNDTKTIADVAVFVSKLMEVMPELSTQDLYLAGESYAGVFVPLLAKEILKMNEQGSGPRVNLKGYLVGNAVADDVFEKNGQIEFAYGLGLIDPPTFRGLQDACHGSFWNATKGSPCKDRIEAAFDIFYWVNQYDIITDCHLKGSDERSMVEPRSRQQQQQQQQQQRDGAGYSSSRWPGRLGHTIACGDRRAAIQYLGMEEVRRAIHAAPVEDLHWEPCSDILDYEIPFPISLIGLHRELVSSGLRALVYSGDHDFVVPFTSTRAWVYSMDLEVEKPYAAWIIDQQVAGFYTKFKLGGGLTFATVKGAGHMVPSSNPREALELVSRFMDGDL